MLKKELLALVMFVAFAALWMFACSSSDDSSGGQVSIGPGPSIAGPQRQPEPVQQLDSQLTEPVDGAIEVQISGAHYLQNRLHIPAGQAVTIRVSNRDSQAHNLRVAGMDGDYQTEDDAVTEPPTIDGNGIGVLQFAPPVPGRYTFHCDFHPGSMGGQIVVD
jgi:plastocyanin